MCIEKVKEGMELLKEAIGGIEHCSDLLQSTVISLKNVEAALKSVVDNMIAMGSKVDRLGKPLTIVGDDGLSLPVGNTNRR